MSNPITVTYSNPRPDSYVNIDVNAFRYTKAADDTGWLRVKLEPGGESAYLCEFVKVAISKEDARTQFAITEGQHKGKQASLTKENAANCLVSTKRGTGAKIVAKIKGREWLVSKPRYEDRLHQLVATLLFDGNSATITLDPDVVYAESNSASPYFNQKRQSKPLPKGTYRIMTPQIPKKPGPTAFYITQPGGYPGLKYHTVWFPIEYVPNHNSNFVHVGNLSEGCVTLYQLEMWNPLYLYRIKNRSDKEGKYVGTVTIE